MITKEQYIDQDGLIKFKKKNITKEVEDRIERYKNDYNPEKIEDDLTKYSLLFLIDNFKLIDSDSNYIIINQNMMTLYDAICAFMETGSKQDALDIYACFLKIYFKGGDFQKMLIMLSECESTASTLVMKHRDHFSHSAYVFLLGIAIYYKKSSSFGNFNKAFNGTGSIKDGSREFFKYWGITSLLHDIGYPFEIPIEQVKTIFSKNKDTMPLLAYKGMDRFNSINNIVSDSIIAGYAKRKNITETEAKKEIDKLLIGKESSTDYSTDRVFAHHINKRLWDIRRNMPNGSDNSQQIYEDVVYEFLKDKASCPEKFKSFMDHAYFSANLVFRQLIALMKEEFFIDNTDVFALGNFEKKMEAITAILLHNSLFNRSIKELYADYETGETSLDSRKHPLAYMLMLCDELQCWDRTSFGKESREEMHPIGFKLSFSDSDEIDAYYVFDNDKLDDAIKIEKDDNGTVIYKLKEGALKKFFFKKECSYMDIPDINRELRETGKGNICISPELYGEKKCVFLSDINEIVRLSSTPMSHNVNLRVGFKFDDRRSYPMSYGEGLFSKINIELLYSLAEDIYKKCLVKYEEKYKVDFSSIKGLSENAGVDDVKLYIDIVKWLTRDLEYELGRFYTSELLDLSILETNTPDLIDTLSKSLEKKYKDHSDRIFVNTDENPREYCSGIIECFFDALEEKGQKIYRFPHIK